MKINMEAKVVYTVEFTEQELARFLLAFDHRTVGTSTPEDDRILIDFYNDLSEALGEE